MHYGCFLMGACLAFTCRWTRPSSRRWAELAYLLGRAADCFGIYLQMQVDSPEFTGAGGALEAVQTRLYSDEVR